MLNYELICNARNGDPIAMQQILNHYAGYMNYAASFPDYNGHRYLNLSIRELIEADLMAAILKWKEKNECTTK